MEGLHRPRFSRSKVIFAMVLFGCLLAAGLWLHRQAQIDRCFDRGGRWNNHQIECEGERQYPGYPHRE
jgi:hypothetical protein